jgi:hypothetical protein
MNRKNCNLIIGLSVIALLFTVGAHSTAKTKTKQKPLKFYDVRVQTPEFIGYYTSIKLTPEQEKIKTEVLSTIPAPCCKEYPVATCCCPCNLAKSVWGLSHYAIANLHYDSKKLKETVLQWIQFINKAGYAGDTCSTGHCGSPFSEGGCGGMKDTNIVF